ncbi:EAL domain-containing protein [Deinococcus sp. 12RED42]|uniref:EAL domain-containing protein n=1 Tax=Deinococcus sp. 12RED42 TaxID=2745872 RepID=UPI001E3DC481|nr:EAL domain-containing protein [Deinococcus sp. 12RED42]MCD0166827.1 EAL domain-containing protein [Deinococcus sp. 12RED42]
MTEHLRAATSPAAPLPAARPLRVLIVEDSEEDAWTYQHLLRRAAPQVQCEVVSVGADAVERLLSDPPDCVLLDFNLPDMTGLEVLTEARPACAVVMLTGVGDEQVAVQALNAGAQDYVVKSTLSGPGLLRDLERAIEKYRLQRELTVSRERMQAALGSVDDALLSLDHDLNLLYLNPAAQRLLGLPEGQRTHAELTAQAAWMFGGAFLTVLRAGLDSGERRSAELHAPQGAWLDARLYPGPGGLTVTLRDVTQRRQEEERLRLLESVAVHAREAVMISDAEPVTGDGPRVVYVNAAFTRMTGYAPEDILGRTPRILQGPDSDRTVLDRIRANLLSWTPVDEVVQNYCKDGTPIWVHLSIVPVADARGWFTHWVSVQRDVTEEVQRERRDRTRRELLEMAAAGRPVDDLLNGLCRLIRLDLGDLIVTAWLRDGHLLSMRASVNSDSDAVRASAHEGVAQVDLRRDDGVSATVIRTRQPLMVGDIRSEEVTLHRGARAALLASGVHAMWTLPVLSSRADEQPLGVFTVFSREARTPTPAELAALQDLTGLASLLIERALAQTRMQRLAMYDSLTGLPNRALYLEYLTQALNRSSHTGERLAVGLLDLNRFKIINDTLGHSAGDELLRQVAQRLRRTFRPSDVIARMGGDEFTLILPFTSEAGVFRRGMETLLTTCFQTPFRVREQELFVTASLGLALTPEHGTDAETLLSAADLAMYRAKRTGGGVAAFDPAAALQPGRVSLETDLHHALDRGELELHYQPLFRAGTRELVGAEALCRWRHPRLGLVSPAEFIPLAENTGLILPIGAWVLNEACRQLAQWRTLHPDLQIGVNLSPRQFWNPQLVQSVQAALITHGLPGSCVVLEITESVLMNVPDAEATLRHLRALGVRLSLDDFGTGYSSLSYLNRFPLTSLKIDRSFLQGVTGDPHGTPEKVIQAVMLLAHALDLHVTTEGIETPEQAAFIEEVGGDILQGYLLGRPVPADQFRLPN